MKWYRHFPSDFYCGVREMLADGRSGREEIAAYIVLLGEMYERGGMLANDDRLLSALLMCDIRTARRLKDALLRRGKFQLEAGILINARVQREVLRTKFRSELSAIAARKRWKNNDRDDAILDTRYKKEGKSTKEIAASYGDKSKVISLELAKTIKERKWDDSPV